MLKLKSFYVWIPLMKSKTIKLSELIKDIPDEPKLDKKGYDDMIKRELQRRRQQGGCSMLRNVGIKYMGDKGMWKQMYGWEVDYYNKHYKNAEKNKQRTIKKLRGKVNE